MRLSWPFRRPDPEAGAPASVADGAMQRLEAPVRHDWRAAGTLHPSFVGDPGIRVQRFPDEIAGSQLPPPILAPLGHARSADGPAGLISGLARPTLAPVARSLGGRADLPLRPGRSSSRVQSVVAAEPGSADATPAVAGPTAVASSTSVDLPATMDRAVDPLPVIEPRRVAVAASPTPPRGASLTVARTPDLTLPPPRARVADMPVVARTVDPGDPAAAMAVPGSGAGSATRTILRTSGGSRVRLGAPIQRSELAAAMPSLELAHRGMRTTSATPTTSVQRHATAAAEEHRPATAGGRVTPDAPLAGGLAMTIQDEPLGSTAGPQEIGSLIPGGLVLARVVANPEPASPSVAAGAHASTEPVASGPAAPLVGTTPVGPISSLRPTIPAPGAAPAPAAAGGGVSRSAGPTGIRSAVQRSTGGRSSESGPPGVTRASRTLPQGSVATSALIARVAPGTADTVSPRAAGPPSPDLVLARVATSFVARANDQRPQESVAPTSGPRPMAVARPLTVLRDSTDVTTVDDTVTEPARPTEAAAPPAAMTTSPDGTTSGGATTAGSTGNAASPLAERDLDEMVRRLYPRLRRSLSSELLVARERAGTLADLR